MKKKEKILAESLTQSFESDLEITDDLFELATNDFSKSETISKENYSYWKSTLRAFLNNKTAVFLLCIVTIVIAFAIVQPYIPGQKSPTKIYNDVNTNTQLRNIPPSKEFFFGTNSIGQDLFSRIWSGTRTSLFIGVTVGLVEAFIGIIIGSLWGYVKKLDRIMTELYNIFDNIPQTIILILFTYILRPGLKTMIFAMCITSWLVMARYVRNQIVIIRDREYNLASKCLGTPSYKIILKNLLPYLISIITLRMALAVPIAIGNEVFLTYIGLGLPLDTPSLGNLINEGRAIIMSPTLRYQLVFPAAVLSAITISFYVLGNVFADSADPRNHV